MLDKPNEAQARPGSLDVQHDASVTWRYLAPAGHTLKDCLEPRYWRNVVREAGLQRVVHRHSYNRIEIIAEDGSWEAELRVMSVGDGAVHTRVIRQWPEPERATQKTAPPLPKGYAVEMIQGNGWRARAPGGDIVAERLTTEEAAIRAAEAHASKATRRS